MAQNVSDFLLERLSGWGVRQVYGYPGDGINGIMGALERRDDPRFVQARHEEMRRVHGLCATRSSPARWASAWRPRGPVRSICSTASTTPSSITSRWWPSSASRPPALGGGYQQEVDLITLFKDVAGEYVHMVMRTRADAAPGRPRRPHRTRRADGHLHHRAERRAGRWTRCRSRRASTARCTRRPAGCVPGHAARRGPRGAAADILNEGKRVAMLVGAGALDAAEEVIEVADCSARGWPRRCSARPRAR